MKTALKVFSISVISLFILSLFGWMVNQVSNKHKEFGFLTEPVKFMYSFPELFKKSVEEVQSLPMTFIQTPANFKPINHLKKDLRVLTTYSDTGNLRTIALMNLKEDTILREWTIENPWDDVARIVNPILLPDGGLVYNYYYRARPGLTRIDSAENVLWVNDSLVVHHGMNLDNDGNIWACTQLPGGKATGKYNMAGRKKYFLDHSISKFDVESGQVLFSKSIAAIMKENGISNYLLKSPARDDPWHLNDVQPALKTTPYYQEGDVFISLRNISAILHYRPSTNEVLNILEGPFIYQHDVDFLGDTLLTIFNNNNNVDRARKSKKPHNEKKRIFDAGTFYANIVSYNFKTGQYHFIGKEIFEENKIFTANEGLAEFIAPDTYFVEEQNSGLLWVIRNDSVIYKNVLASQHEGYQHLPNWTRIVGYGDGVEIN